MKHSEMLQPQAVI